MKRWMQALVMLVLGAGVLRVTLCTEMYLRYVKEGLRPYLIASGVLLVVLGSIGLVLDGWFRYREGRDDGHDAESDAEAPDGGGHSGHDHAGGDHSGHHDSGHHGHGHSGNGPRIAWLLALPALALLFFAPPALGSYTAARERARTVPPNMTFAALPAADPVPLTLTEFTGRVQQDGRHALAGRRVQLTGFVTPTKDGQWQLTRLVVNCCAADSQVLRIAVYGAAAPPADTWVTVTGTWHKQGTLGTRTAGVGLDVTGVQRIEEPPNRYLDVLLRTGADR